MTVLLFIIWCLFCLMLAHLLTGFGHWAEDTYGHLGMPEILRAGIGWIGIQTRRGSAEREGV